MKTFRHLTFFCTTLLPYEKCLEMRYIEPKITNSDCILLIHFNHKPFGKQYDNINLYNYH